MNNQQIGQEIYYHGDMANSDGFGKIEAVHRDARFGDQVTIAMDDGREITIPPMMIRDEYHGNGGIRFCTVEAYNKWNTETIEDMQRRYGKAL